MNKHRFRFTILTFLLLQSFTLSFVLGAEDTVLEKKISVNLDTTIYYSLNTLGDSIGYYFSYNANLFDTNEVISYTFIQKPVKYILDSIFFNKKMDYQIIGNQIVLYKTEKEKIKPGEYNNTNYSFSGKIVDDESMEGIPFATIGLLKKNNWAVCNTSGEFNLNISKENLNDSIFISCLGYKKLNLSVDSLFNTPDHIITLPIEYMSIQEVVIRKINPVTLIEKCLKEISHNYNSQAAMFNGFYRENVYKGENLKSVTEGVVDGIKASYTNYIKNDQVRLLKARKIMDKQCEDSLILKLQAGIYNSMLLDIVKNPADFLQNNFISLYKYRMSDIILSGNKEIYVIEFNRNIESAEAFYKGKIYIDYERAAIVSVEFSLNQAGIEKATGYMVLRKPAGIRIKSGGANYMVNYVFTNDSLYKLNYIRSESIFKIKQKKQLFYSEYRILSEMAITSYDADISIRFSRNEIVNQKDIFVEQVTTYDENFWKNYNYIPPEKSLLEALKEINVQK